MIRYMVKSAVASSASKAARTTMIDLDGMLIARLNKKDTAARVLLPFGDLKLRELDLERYKAFKAADSMNL